MNRGPKFIPRFEYIPESLAQIQVSTGHVHMGAMIGRPWWILIDILKFTQLFISTASS